MPHEWIKVSGKIEHVFAHRFVVRTAKGAVLADLTPHGADLIALRVGAEVELEGEMKPSELKVSRFVSGGKTVSIEHKKNPDHGPHEPADQNRAIEAVRAAGFEPTGKPRRKPKHFEIDG